MKYIFDFDEVLFNTAALKEKMKSIGIPESGRDLAVFEKITESDVNFSFSSLVFPGALAFLQAHGDDCIVVSSATSETEENNTDLEEQLAFQSEKIAQSGVKALVSAVYVVGTSKTEMLEEIKHTLEAQHIDMVFVDDRRRYLDQALALGIKSIQMDRTCQVGPMGAQDRDYPCVGSFASFIKVIASWKTSEMF